MRTKFLAISSLIFALALGSASAFAQGHGHSDHGNGQAHGHDSDQGKGHDKGQGHNQGNGHEEHHVRGNINQHWNPAPPKKNGRHDNRNWNKKRNDWDDQKANRRWNEKRGVWEDRNGRAIIVQPNVNDVYHQRQQTKNEWRNLAVLGGVVGALGLLTHEKTLVFAGSAGALYSLYRYEQDRKSQSQIGRARAYYFSQPYFIRDGQRYNRRLVTSNGQRSYQFVRG